MNKTFIPNSKADQKRNKPFGVHKKGKTMREKLIELLSATLCNGNDKVVILRKAAEIIADHLIANGVTILVRCKNCAHVDRYGDCDIMDEWSTRKPDDFCSYGSPAGESTK